MITKETLELAAKAAGYVVENGRGWNENSLVRKHERQCGGFYYDPFDPSADDADAFRLQIDLGLNVFQAGNSAYACFDPEDAAGIEIRVSHDGDKRKATREAITLCAAEIGRMMK